MVNQPLVLDTNIISETIKISPNQNVIAWLLKNEQNLYLTSITVGELLTGVFRLPQGKRREKLLLAIERIIGSYQSRVLPYDASSARSYVMFLEQAHEQGRLLTVEDGMIAAICSDNSATLVTRNTKDFEYLGLTLINPFETNF